MRRLAYFAIILASVALIYTWRTNHDTPPRLATGFPFINELVAGINPYKLARDIVALSCIESELIDAGTIKINCASKITTDITLAEAFRLADQTIARSRKSIASWKFSEKKPLQSIAQKYHFKVSTQPAPAEALAIYDFAVNRILVRRLLESLAQGIKNGTIRSEELKQVGRQGIDMIDGYVANIFQPKLIEIVEKMRSPQNATLLYIAIGCGSAEKDVSLISALRQHYSELTVFPYCLDPYQSPKNHPMVRLGGVLDTTPLAKGETLIARAEKALGNASHLSLVVGHYAFHHIGQSFPAFLESIGQAPLMLLETYTPSPWMLSSFQRSRKIGIDLLMNLGLDTLRGNNWVADALAHQKADIFQVYYLHEELINAYQDAADITWLDTNKMVLSIVPKSRRSITKSSANTK